MKTALVILLSLILIVLIYKPVISILVPPSSQEIELMGREYDQSLYDPTLIRITDQGSLGSDRLNQRRDCLRLESPSNLMQTCSVSGIHFDPAPYTTLKSSSQWYLARPDTNLIIVEPTGWLDIANPTQYWYSHLITFDEYMTRLNHSRVESAKYSQFKNQEPF